MDVIGNLLTKIRNAGYAKHLKVDIPSSHLKEGLVVALKESGYIKDYRVAQDGKQGILRVYLKYSDGKHNIAHIQRVSRPGRRVYVPVDKIPKIRSGYGIAILSTSQGVLTGEKAAEKKVGGEILCEVW